MHRSCNAIVHVFFLFHFVATFWRSDHEHVADAPRAYDFACLIYIYIYTYIYMYLFYRFAHSAGPNWGMRLLCSVDTWSCEMFCLRCWRGTCQNISWSPWEVCGYVSEVLGWWCLKPKKAAVTAWAFWVTIFDLNVSLCYVFYFLHVLCFYLYASVMCLFCACVMCAFLVCYV